MNSIRSSRRYVLIELYVLLRNSAVVKSPLHPEKAVTVCQRYRENPKWRLVDYPGSLMNEIWEYISKPDVGRRAIFDARLGAYIDAYSVLRYSYILS